MRWQDKEQSGNVEDRRGRQTGMGAGMGGGFGRGLPIRGKFGLVVIVVIIVAGYYGIDLTPMLGGSGLDGTAVSQRQDYTPSPQEEELARFSSVTLKMTEDAWQEIFSRQGQTYTPARMVLYTGATSTSCGYGQSAMGPFYCPADQTVYIDLSFYQDMKNSLGGGGDFAQGYVIAHEIGHHIQHLSGIEQKVSDMRARSDPKQANKLSVMLELQADCFAGVWGHMIQEDNVLEPGDVEQALRTAEAIGDDRLQRQTQGHVVPDSFTHGTSEQRYTWFNKGLNSGDPSVCDTFSGI